MQMQKSKRYKFNNYIIINYSSLTVFQYMCTLHAEKVCDKNELSIWLLEKHYQADIALENANESSFFTWKVISTIR